MLVNHFTSVDHSPRTHRQDYCRTATQYQSTIFIATVKLSFSFIITNNRPPPHPPHHPWSFIPHASGTLPSSPRSRCHTVPSRHNETQGKAMCWFQIFPIHLIDQHDLKAQQIWSDVGVQGCRNQAATTTTTTEHLQHQEMPHHWQLWKEGFELGELHESTRCFRTCNKNYEEHVYRYRLV